MKKIPYGISSYDTIKTDNYYFVDKTKYIEQLENLGGRYLFFLRPRRFGKSLFISILEHYYDICSKDRFEQLFGDTYIGKNPTPLKNSYPVLRFNFSMVRTQGTVEQLKDAFCLNVWGEMDAFISKYQHIYNFDEDISKEIKNQDDPGNMLLLFYNEMKKKHVRLFMIIDEYDNFANNVLVDYKEETYQKLTHGTGFLRNFFTHIKGLTDNREIDRLFISGVSPLVMADVTSGYNIGDNISLSGIFGSMVGFNQDELKELIDYYIPGKYESLMPLLSEWYDNYCFDENHSEKNIFNSTSILYFLKENFSLKRIPTNMIDENLRTDYGKLRFLIIQEGKLNGNFNILKDIVETNQKTSALVRSFPQNQLVNEEKFVSLLFYLGLLTIQDVSITNRFTLTIPNKLIRILLWEYLQNAYIDAFKLKIKTNFLIDAFDSMAKTGEWKPVLQYIIDKFYEAVSLRDFTFHEEGVKTFLLAWLNLTNLYDITSEKEQNKGFADISLSPDRRFTEYVKYDYIIELKYVKAEDINTPAKEKTAIKQAIKTATTQLLQYAANEKFKTIKIIVVASAKKLLYLESLAN